MSDAASRITRILQSSDGIEGGELLPLIYEELRQLARARIANEKGGHTLQPTALVHEAWMRVSGDNDPGWNGRRHFFGAAAEAMRRILIERARQRQRLRHGGGRERLDLDPDAFGFESDAADLLVIEECLDQLEQADPRAREVANLRYFAGLGERETADLLGVSVSTVQRDWRFIRTFLQERLREGEQP